MRAVARCLLFVNEGAASKLRAYAYPPPPREPERVPTVPDDLQQRLARDEQHRIELDAKLAVLQQQADDAHADVVRMIAERELAAAEAARRDARLLWELRRERGEPLQ